MKYPKELAGIRGLAAAYVLVRHSLASLPQSFVGDLLNNNYGVKLFMIVSGFSIFWLLDSKKPTYGRFIAGRFFRIFPVYLVGLVIYSLMLGFIKQTFTDAPTSVLNATRLVLVQAAQTNFVAHFLAHATLLHGLIPDDILHYSDYTLLGQAWSLSVELQLYLVAPLLIAWLSTIDRARSQILLAGFVFTLLWIGSFLSAGFLGNNLAMFSIGLLSYMIAKNVEARANLGIARGFVAGILILAAIWDASTLPSVLIWVATLYAVLAAGQGVFASVVSRFLRSRPLAYLGRISYSFYIFHMAALFPCLRLIDRAGTPGSLRYILLPVASFALTVIFSEIAYRWIERPSHRFGKTVTERKDAALAPLVPALDGPPPLKA